MGLIGMKEKVIKTLGEFLDRNKEYMVKAYISDSTTNSMIGKMFITTDRTFKTDDRKATLEWDNSHDIKFNNFSLLYDEILACYEEVDEYNQQMVYMILKCGVSIDFECVGMRI